MIVRINNDLQGTSSSFSNLFQNHELSSGNSSAKISVYLHASVLVKVESNGKTVVVNNSLLGGVQIRSNQIEPDQSDVNLLKLRSQVETCKLMYFLITAC